MLFGVQKLVIYGKDIKPNKEDTRGEIKDVCQFFIKFLWRIIRKFPSVTFDFPFYLFLF